MKSKKKKNLALACPFCRKGREPDYKNFEELRKYLSERARILGKNKTGVCSKHQRILTKEIKRARFLGLLPFVQRI